MVSYQRKKDEFNDVEENFIYMFGGIKVVDKEDMTQLTIDQVAQLNGSAFIFMADLWRFELLSNQWVQVEVYGISEITRNLFLWNGT